MLAKRRLLAYGLVLVLLLAAGCGQVQEPKAPEPAPATPAPAPAPAPVTPAQPATPVKDILRVGCSEDTDDLGVGALHRAADHLIGHNIYNGLYKLNPATAVVLVISQGEVVAGTFQGLSEAHAQLERKSS